MGIKYPSVTEVLGVYADFSQVRPDVLEAACARGDGVHLFGKLYALGEFAVMPKGLEGYCLSLKNWFDENVVEVIAVEIELVNETIGYCGHPDLIAILRGDKRPTVVDWKSPAALNRLWAAQCAAYMDLSSRWDPWRCASVRLRADGGKALFKDYSTSEADFQAFKCALWAHNYFKE